MFYEIIEIAVVIFLFWAGITQIILPSIRGTKFFPIFQKEAKLQENMEEVKQKIAENKLKKEINNLKEKENL